MTAPKENHEEKPEFSELEEKRQEISQDILEHKKVVEKFKDEILKKFDQYVAGVELIIPKKFVKNKIDVLVLIEDADSKKMSKYELKKKLADVIDEMGKKADKRIKAETMLISELKEGCFDSKYEILDMIAKGIPLYDKGILSALKVAEVHKNMAIEKFEKYVVSYVLAGSFFRGDANPNDIDVYVVIDDTDVKKMSRFELRDKLRAIISGMGFEASHVTGVQAQFHIQTYILTDFWDALKDANPVIFTLLRDGVPLYDRGVFMPWKLLLQMGRIKPSPEAIDMNMDVGEKLIQRIKQKLLSVLGEDLFYAVMNPSQAALMLYGLTPPTPKETVKLMDEIFVKREKLLERKYIDVLEKIRKSFKDVEHGKLQSITGREVDELVKDAEDYLKRLQKLFNQIEKKETDKKMGDIYDSCNMVVRDAISLVTKEDISDLDKGFKKYLVDQGKMPERMLDIFRLIRKTKLEYKKKKISKQEVDKIYRESRILIKVLVDFIERKRAIDIERAKITIKYEDKIAEVILLGDKAFIIANVENKEDVQLADLTNECGLCNIRGSSLEEFEKLLAKTVIPKRVFIKERIFEDLRKLFGKNVEIMVSS